jgi:tricarballylate dehydrogenase
MGGNSYFTLGSFRTTYDGLTDVMGIIDDPGDVNPDTYELPPYTKDDFAADMRRVTKGRTDEKLMRVLVENSFPMLQWLHSHGIKFKLQSDNQVFEVNGKKRFWGGGTIAVVGGGIGLIDQHLAAAKDMGIAVKTEHRMVGFQRGPEGAVTGVVCDSPTGRKVIEGKAVVLASGGFEADARLRAAYLGPGWETARVRGSRYNTGEGLIAALEYGAQAFGNWSGAHAVAWDKNAGVFGDRVLTNKLQRHSYPFGIMVNAEGRRFIDEASDFRNYTYAMVGAAILRQPGGVAFQVFDKQGMGMLRTDYGHEGISRVTADSIAELAEKMEVSPQTLCATVDDFNAAVQETPFDPTVLDGKRTVDVNPPKSNWARQIIEPPFTAYPTVCAITFTYGGLRIDTDARVLDQRDQPIPGLHAAGECVGGLFYENYPGGSGLMSGAVFGYRAGKAAAKYSQGR